MFNVISNLLTKNLDTSSATFSDDVSKKYQHLLKDQKSFFESIHDGMTVDNHKEHFENPDYWDILLGDVKSNPDKWKGKTALDFGCGCGRNIKTLLDLAKWKRVDGVDISSRNAKYAQQYVEKEHGKGKCKAWDNDGHKLHTKNNEYDFIMSTVVLQHIPSYEIRYSILKDMYSGLKKGGMISLQFGDMSNSCKYHFNKTKFDENNMNSRVENPEYISKDLEKIGFKDISIVENTEVFHCKWYFVKAIKK